jgi:hypothetical protein
MVSGGHSSIHPSIHMDGGGVSTSYPHPTTSNDRTPDPHTATTDHPPTQDRHYYYYRYNFLSICIVMWLSVLACVAPGSGSGMVGAIVVGCG